MLSKKINKWSAHIRTFVLTWNSCAKMMQVYIYSKNMFGTYKNKWDNFK